ncbi:hypothetical protein [Mycobacterium sp. HM-7]
MAPNAPQALVRRAFALFREGGVQAREARLSVASFVTWRAITSTDDLTHRDIAAIVHTLEYWKACGEIEYRCRRIAEQMATAATTSGG